MATSSIGFNDGEGYEHYMGVWSQLAGETFLGWLAPATSLRWLDVGCGNGAFTEMLVDRCEPASVEGVDPSQEQLVYARTRPALHAARFQLGDAMALPYANDSFDAAVMPLVIFFVPEPARGVAEMARVVRAGGSVSAYAWDMPGGGFPYAKLLAELRGMGVAVPTQPSPDASRLEVMRELWAGAGLEDIDTLRFTVERTFADFDEYWATIQRGPRVSSSLTAMPAADREKLKERMREHLPPDAAGRITYGAQAHAIKGRVPG